MMIKNLRKWRTVTLLNAIILLLIFAFRETTYNAGFDTSGTMLFFSMIAFVLAGIVLRIVEASKVMKEVQRKVKERKKFSFSYN